MTGGVFAGKAKPEQLEECQIESASKSSSCNERQIYEANGDKSLTSERKCHGCSIDIERTGVNEFSED